MKLNQIDYGTIYEVVNFEGDLNEKRRLFSLGIYNGCKLRLIRRSMLMHNFLIFLNGFVYAINDDIAKKIIVKEI